MLRRMVIFAPLMALFLAPAAVRAQDAPTVVVRVRSLDAVTENVKLLVALAGREEIAKQVEALIKAKVGQKGLEGIDPTRPLGAYAKIGMDLQEVTTIAMVPIADQAAFLSLLENLNIPVQKNKNDVYTVKTGTPFEVYFRFADKYAYFTTLNIDFLDQNKLLKPEAVFTGKQASAISATVRLDQIPNAAKLIALAQIEQELTKAQQNAPPNETTPQQALRLQILKEIGQVFASVIKDGAELNAGINIDKATNELAFSLSLSGQPKSELADLISGIGASKSLFAGMGGSTSSVSGAVHLTLPPSVQKTLDGVIEEARTKALAGINDAGKRKQAETLFDALLPTLKSGEVDTAVAIQGPNKDKQLTLVTGLRLKDGDKLGKTVHGLVTDLLKDIPPVQAAKIKLDAETAAGVSIHRLDFGANFDKKARDAFGEHPVYVAFRNDALFLALGPDGLAIIKDALTKKGEASAPPIHLEIAVAKLAPLIADTDQKRAVLGKLFAAGEDGKVRFSILGGSALKVQMLVDLSVVRFLSAAIVKADGQ